MCMTFDITTREQLAEVVRELLARMQTADFAILLLEGDLGAGKTTLAQEMGKQLGVEGIQSPTYTLLRTHDMTDGRQLHHLDLYRVQAREELEVAGVTELLLQGQGLFIIEWPRFLEDILPLCPCVLHCTLALAADGTRSLTLA